MPTSDNKTELSEYINNMSKIKEINGFIFNSRCQTLVNTVNCDGVMGKGLALEFRLRFPDDMFAMYEKFCKQKELSPGRLLLYKKSNPWVLNFPTKLHWNMPSKIQYIEEGLRKLSLTYKNKGITSIAFPHLGTLSGGLDWKEVKIVMKNNLEKLDNLYIEIYNFDPDNKNTKDPLFYNLKEIILKNNNLDFSKIGINEKKINLLKEKIKSGEVFSMYGLQKLKGFGKKTIENCYTIAKEHRLDEEFNDTALAASEEKTGFEAITLF